MRRKDREITDENRIREILEGAKYMHIAMHDGEYPYLVAMHYGYVYEGGKLTLYAHGAKEGHKNDLAAADRHVTAEIECGVQDISGGDIACRYGSAYASVLGRGEITMVQDPEEKVRGLRILMKHQTGREFAMTAEMAAAVTVFRLDIKELTAKMRSMPALG